ncbi:hypothetical protein M9H77_22141 [Catharanthus roseus]|uniref:Uncharacterized protein n=1 Tax=Catharanthus roseus TaxID=4058 RepID=A0ACC0APC5_CATRO|nr:hypothetical protein M9H77_22141 [Catharanthus roseus]
MASFTSRALGRLSSRLQPTTFKLNSKKASMPFSMSADSFKSASESTVKRCSLLSRLPVELTGVESMLPLHSAIASARLRSSLSIESQTWGLVPQVHLQST